MMFTHSTACRRLMASFTYFFVSVVPRGVGCGLCVRFYDSPSWIRGVERQPRKAARTLECTKRGEISGMEFKLFVLVSDFRADGKKENKAHGLAGFYCFHPRTGVLWGNICPLITLPSLYPQRCQFLSSLSIRTRGVCLTKSKQNIH
jgi:hypothetical protein